MKETECYLNTNASSNFLERLRTCRIVEYFSNIIAHDHTDAAIKPIITTFVIVSEDHTISHKDICSVALCATSERALDSIF